MGGFDDGCAVYGQRLAQHLKSVLGIHIPRAITDTNSETDNKGNYNEKDHEEDHAGKLPAETAVSSVGWHPGVEGSHNPCLEPSPLYGCSRRKLLSTMARCGLPFREIMSVSDSCLALKIHDQGAYAADEFHVGRSQEEGKQVTVQSTEGKALIFYFDL